MINPRLAVALTGGVVGLVGVALTTVAGRGCEVIRGVGSCGGIGLLALLVILVLEILLGAALLKAWRLTDPTSTSFLGVGLAAVFVMLFLLESLESVWMFLVIPAAERGDFPGFVAGHRDVGGVIDGRAAPLSCSALHSGGSLVLTTREGIRYRTKERAPGRSAQPQPCTGTWARRNASWSETTCSKCGST